MQKPSSERDNKDLKVLADLTSNVPAFKSFLKDNHRKFCSKMIGVIDDGDKFVRPEEGFSMYRGWQNFLAYAINTSQNKLRAEHDAPSKHKAGSI